MSLIKLENFWEIDTPNMFGQTGNGIGWSNVAPAGNSMFPREWVVKMNDYNKSKGRWVDERTEKIVQVIFDIEESKTEADASAGANT